ncbi:hypothetical protein N9J88_03270 [Porticoccaceae bacterium]|nr:hypothetical protein [Porticoccaceae bacterium]
MAATKRSKQQVLKDQALTAEMYLRGWRQADIAKHLTALAKTRKKPIRHSIDMVKYDMGAIRDNWMESSLRDFDSAKAEQLAKLDQMELEAWREWQRSCEDYNKKTTTVHGKVKGKKTETGGQAGDPRYLTAILSIVERRCRLLGLDLPQKIAPTTPDGSESYQPKDLSDKNLQGRINELLAKVQADGDG